MRRIFVFFFCVGLSSFIGCASMHNGSDLSKLDDFKIERNVTTEKQLVDEFGPPMHTTTRGDGTKVLTWNDTHSSYQLNPASMVPGVGFFVHDEGSHATFRTLNATIRDGIVVDYTTSDSSTS